MATLANDKKEIFESLPVPKAVAKLMIPAVFSQVVTLIYNIADAFFIGKTGDPYMVASVSVAYTVFFALMAVGNLFGIGGGSLASRLMGAKKTDDVKRVSAFSFYGGLVGAIVVAALVMIFMDPFLAAIGSSENTRAYNYQYVVWVGVIGSVPTVASMVLSHLLRSEGHAKAAGFGIAAGGILNIILDPILIFGCGLAVKGAAMATMLSNLCTAIFFLFVFRKIRKNTLLSLKPKDISLSGEYVKPCMAIGLPAFFTTVLTAIGTCLTINLMATYGDFVLAAYGVTKKLDLILYYISLGISYGVLPLIAYNYSAKNYARMASARDVTMVIAIIAALLYTAAGTFFGAQMVRFFIDEETTVSLGKILVGIECLSTPLNVVNDMFVMCFQAMGKGRQSMVLSIVRNGVVRIPCILLLNYLFQMRGIVWAQFASNAIMLVITVIMYRKLSKELREKEAEDAPAAAQ